MKKVLIAHQSGIPHYRVPFYEALAKSCRPHFAFDVVHDSRHPALPSLSQADLTQSFSFATREVTTWELTLSGKRVRYQSFLRHVSDYDLVVVEHVLHNLSYPLSQWFQPRGKPLMYWGHGRDVRAGQGSLVKRAAERLKLGLARSAQGYFAYTEGVRAFLVDRGLPPHRIFVLNNTIDILAQRATFEQHVGRRDTIRMEMGLDGKRVLLFVGRLTSEKRLDFLLHAFDLLRARDTRYRLLIVGAGPMEALVKGREAVETLGPILDRDALARVFVASDVFAFPGDVGLGPLQALCYDLPIVTIDSHCHKPEFEYLSAKNAVILPQNTDPAAYTLAIHDLFKQSSKLNSFTSTIWPSISHLTIESMASRFIAGVNATLGQRPS